MVGCSSAGAPLHEPTVHEPTRLRMGPRGSMRPQGPLLPTGPTLHTGLSPHTGLHLPTGHRWVRLNVTSPGNHLGRRPAPVATQRSVISRSRSLSRHTSTGSDTSRGGAGVTLNPDQHGLQRFPTASSKGVKPPLEPFCGLYWANQRRGVAPRTVRFRPPSLTTATTPWPPHNFPRLARTPVSTPAEPGGSAAAVP